MNLQELWSFLIMAEDDLSVEDAVAGVKAARGRFEDALRRANTEQVPTLDVAAVRREFDRVEKAVAEAGPEERQTLADAADRLSRLRAYVYPASELQVEGKAAFADLTQWGVPVPILSTLQSDFLAALGAPGTTPDPPFARAALRALYEAYDYWGWYIDWYADYMRQLAWRLLALEAAALVFTLNRFVYGDVVLGFLGAGVCGALVSVISKMPPLMADAESNTYLRRILMRVGTGVAAVLIGGGFVASGIVSVTLPNTKVTITDTIELCGKDPDRPASGGPSWLPWLTAKLKRQPLPVETPRVQTAAPAARCTTAGFLLLLGLGLVLGFSERALTSFEDKIFPAPARSG